MPVGVAEPERVRAPLDVQRMVFLPGQRELRRRDLLEHGPGAVGPLAGDREALVRNREVAVGVPRGPEHPAEPAQ